MEFTVIFNTEAHPFEAPPLKARYGSGNLVPAKAFTPQSVGVPGPVISPNAKVGGVPSGSGNN